MDDALLKLAMPEGKYALQITLLSPGGRPLSNIAITGLTTITGGAVKTDANGKAFGFAASNPVTVTADLSKFLDLTGNVSRSFSLASGVVNQGVITATRASSAQKLFTSSGAFYFSPDVAEYDWSAIGGGYNGGAGRYSNSGGGAYAYFNSYGGDGGNAGGVINNQKVSYNNELLNIIVGAANGGKSSVNGTQTPNGAAGGKGAYAYTHNSYEKGSKQNATDGAATTESFLYPPTSVGGAGGGGGAYSENDYNDSQRGEPGNGGRPGGGNGSNGSNESPGSAGSGYGSGGGGGFAAMPPHDGGYSPWTSGGGAGKQGVVGFMWRYKS